MEISNIVSVEIAPAGLSQTKNSAVRPPSGISETNRTEPESIWRIIASKYDVRSITAEETADLSQKLYDAGEISLLDHAILSFDPDHNIPYGTGFLTQADSMGHRDLITEYQARIDLDNKTGNRKNIVNNGRVLSYLERLDAARKAPIHITA